MPAEFVHNRVQRGGSRKRNVPLTTVSTYMYIIVTRFVPDNVSSGVWYLLTMRSACQDSRICSFITAFKLLQHKKMRENDERSSAFQVWDACHAPTMLMTLCQLSTHSQHRLRSFTIFFQLKSSGQNSATVGPVREDLWGLRDCIWGD